MHERGRARPRGDHGPGRGRCLAGKRPEKASAALESIETISRTAQDELRVVLGLLRDGEAAHPPTAVVIANIASAIGAVRAAHLAGMHVPAQVSVVSVHDLPLVGYLEPPLTTVRMPVEEPGCRGIEVLSAYLPPIDHPRGLMMKLAYFSTRRQLGKVITPVRVHSARMPPAFGSC
jgi:DNA-binding LacI/PurR family transcriptional regulator